MALHSRIDNPTARALFLDRHGLAAPPSGPGKGADLNDVIDTLGFVQVDTINTVSRAHHMILHARRPAYRPAGLAWLHDRDRAVFEHWTHDASLISMQHFPHWRLRFARHRARIADRWTTAALNGVEEKAQEILRRVADDGPCGSGDVGEGEARSSGGWWDWHPSKVAMEYLWRIGELSVTRRESFRKIYDLTENVIPPEYLNARPTLAETVHWACASAMDRLGFATAGELAAFWDLISSAEARAWCAAAQTRGEIVPVEVELADGSWRKSFARPGIEGEAPPVPPSRLRVLSPFDPALRDRKRAERLFGFHYRIEIFVPEHKRRYGYYVFPLLEGDRLVGRIDMKADREADCLSIRALWPEAGVRFGTGRLAQLDRALERTAKLAEVAVVLFQDNWLRQTV